MESVILHSMLIPLVDAGRRGIVQIPGQNGSAKARLGLSHLFTGPVYKLYCNLVGSVYRSTGILRPMPIWPGLHSPRARSHMHSYCTQLPVAARSNRPQNELRAAVPQDELRPAGRCRGGLPQLSNKRVENYKMCCADDLSLRVKLVAQYQVA